MKKIILFLLVVISNTIQSQVVLSATQILNIAAKQRMLTQKMVKAKVCLTLNIDNDISVKDLNSSMILFQENLKLLKNFKSSVEVKLKITAVERLWDSFAYLINTFNQDTIKKVFDSNNYLLDACDDLLTEVRNDINNEAEKKLQRENETRRTTAVSGSLRYLSQRLSYLSLCEIDNSLGIDVTNDLNETNLKFVETTSELTKNELNTTEIKSQIKQVLKDYNQIKNLKKDNKLTPKMIVDQCNIILSSSDKLTTLYLGLLK